MNIKIKYYIQNNYGSKHYYLLGEFAHTISKLTGKKTVSLKDIENLKKLGIEFEQVININNK